MAPRELAEGLFPAKVTARVFITHTRPGPMLGALNPLCTGPRTVGLGYSNHGGTLDTSGMLFVNCCPWAHAVDAVARLEDGASVAR